MPRKAVINDRSCSGYLEEVKSTHLYASRPVKKIGKRKPVGTDARVVSERKGAEHIFNIN